MRPCATDSKPIDLTLHCYEMKATIHEKFSHENLVLRLFVDQNHIHPEVKMFENFFHVHSSPLIYPEHLTYNRTQFSKNLWVSRFEKCIMSQDVLKESNFLFK